MSAKEQSQDIQVNIATSDWSSDEWKQCHQHLLELLGTALKYVQHDKECSWAIDMNMTVFRTGRIVRMCDCGLDGWNEEVKQLTEFNDA